MSTPSPDFRRLATRQPPRTGQQGVALVVALLLMIVATLTGLAGIRNSALQESMTGNLYDRALAMQAAEAALAAAADALSTGTANSIDCSPDVATPCRVVPANAFTGTDDDWQALPTTFVINDALQTGLTPQFHVQWVGAQNVPLTGQAANCLQYGTSGCPEARFNIYRITARSDNPTLNNGRAIVVLSRLARVPLL